ncbi:MAG TPA: PHB depolymerase family esterase [Reyranella sp.]|nr:PHB depolymerase family esterase [Reyranella sp.]
MALAGAGWALADEVSTFDLTQPIASTVITIQGTVTPLLGAAPTPTPVPGEEPLPTGGVVPVASFGSNPGALKMYAYVPPGMRRDAPLVVVMHGCNSNAATMDAEPGWIEMADAYKFALVLPETSYVNEPNYSCFRSWDPAHNRRGVGESLSIKQMVDHMQKAYRTSRTRVFATGFSSGAINTSVLLAAYPDVFAAGAEMSGHPYRCASSYDEFVNCNLFGRTRTAQEWGDLVREAYPGYAGPRPRMSIWHGTADPVVTQLNAPEVVKQWTNVHGIDDTPDVTDLVNGYPHFVWTDSAGTPKVERYVLTGMSHQIAINPFGPLAPKCGVEDGFSHVSAVCSAYYVAKWFGIAD